MIVVSHPTVNQYVRALVIAFFEQQRLKTFHTTLAFGRRAINLPRHKLRQHPFLETVRLVCQRLDWQTPIRHDAGWASVDSVARALDESVARTLKTGDAVYCYEDCSLETFRRAKHAGLRRYYELPILYWEAAKRLLEEEAGRYPDWKQTLLGHQDSTEKQQRKTEELALADLVICPSENVQASLPAGARSIVAGYGCSEPNHWSKERRSAKLRVLFAGELSQRKGLADLFAAMRELKRLDVELVVFGALKADLNFYRNQWPSFVYEPPRSNREFRELMRTCDVLVLPSIVEGRAMVQLEALSCGLPIVVTPNAGGKDLVEQGVTGFLVPIRAPGKIAEALGWIADHKEWLNDVRPDVFKKAKNNPWSKYTETILAALE
jgi:glycosyltransferase involved in cell wall biosynthesis